MQQLFYWRSIRRQNLRKQISNRGWSLSFVHAKCRADMKAMMRVHAIRRSVFDLDARKSRIRAHIACPTASCKPMANRLTDQHLALVSAQTNKRYAADMCTWQQRLQQLIYGSISNCSVIRIVCKHGSARTVLCRTNLLSMETCQIRMSAKLKPLNRSSWNLAKLITSATSLDVSKLVGIVWLESVKFTHLSFSYY
jgi:hypothetical protein